MIFMSGAGSTFEAKKVFKFSDLEVWLKTHSNLTLLAHTNLLSEFEATAAEKFTFFDFYSMVG
jgi:hypothetical protein